MAKYISIDDISDDMVLAEPVLNNFGQTLLPSGLNLEEKHKRILKTWNIRTVAIKAEEIDEDAQISEEIKKLATERITRKMKWEPRNPLEKNMLQMAIVHISRQILRKK